MATHPTEQQAWLATNLSLRAALWIANGKRGLADERALTLLAMLELIERFLPKVVLIENVHGFIRGRHSFLPSLRDWEATLRQKASLGYTIQAAVLNAADYGVPQNRRRAIIVLVRTDIQLQWHWPNAAFAENPITAWDALHDLEPEEVPSPRGKWSALLPSIPEGWNYQWLTSQGGGDELFGYRTRYWNFLLKLAKNLPSWTIPANPGPSTGPFHWDNRPLTAREKQRLQSFPDEWVLSGGSRIQTRLVGNATPPLMAEVIGQQIAKILDGNRDIGHPSLTRLRANKVGNVVVPAPVPSEFHSMVSPKPMHLGAGKGPMPRHQ